MPYVSMATILPKQLSEYLKKDQSFLQIIQTLGKN